MRRRIISLALFLLSGAAILVAAGLTPMPQLPWSIKTVTADKETLPDAKSSSAESVAKHAATALEETTAALGLDDTKTDGAKNASAHDGPSLDVSRISPNGSSVFAGGGAPPKSYVTLMENGTTVGTVQADEHGDWSLVTEHRFASLDPKLTFKTDTNAPAALQPAVPAPSATASAASPAAEVMQKFEGLVAEAREHAKTQTRTAEANTASSSPSPTTETTATRATSKTDATAGAPSPPSISTHVSIPVPIMFVYNEAKLTEEGRHAADLLLEYVQLEHLPNIELSGHADERGTDGYNMDLSRERLETVARILRDGGYSGQLDLKPKGKSEPFAGVDRSKYAQDALYQLDRRVELHIIR